VKSLFNPVRTEDQKKSETLSSLPITAQIFRREIGGMSVRRSVSSRTTDIEEFQLSTRKFKKLYQTTSDITRREITADVTDIQFDITNTKMLAGNRYGWIWYVTSEIVLERQALSRDFYWVVIESPSSPLTL
jgi:hypothetical protein